MDFINFKILDIVDILLVAFLLFQLYKLLKGTVAIKIFVGIATIYLIWKLVEGLQMQLLSEILGQFIGVGVLAVIIVFQQELRKFLLFIGNNKVFSKEGLINFKWSNEEKDVKLDTNSIINACQNMKKNMTGVLIVLTKQDKLKNYVESGEFINAIMSSSLLENIFFKNSPMHDGAVIISDNKIIASRCVLPVINNDSFPKHLGMRHRAAAGVTEDTDCIAIILSEERGEISIAKNGELKANITIAELKNQLEQEFN
tara:strand:+ start:359 stop:1129 length:771 start_codon:yes stop_codon:yes gene_type:complete